MAPERWVVFAAVALPFLAAALLPLGYRLLGERVGYAGAAVAAACFGLVAEQPVAQREQRRCDERERDRREDDPAFGGH